MAAEVNSMDESSFDVVAVLPAGGCGVRMNMELPKQFYRIMGRPLISYTLEAFESVIWIKEIVVPISENYLKEAQQILSEFSHTKVRLTLGGSTRHRSIWNGIQALTADGRSSPSVVILHDAVRPFVDEQTLRSVTIAAKKHGAAGVIRPLASTVIAQLSDGFLDHSLDRSKFRASEMPQAFQYDIIKKAYEQCTEYDFEFGTECLHLSQKYADTRALLIDGPESLWKVTYSKDLYAVEGVLREKQAHSAVIVGKSPCSFLDKLNEQFHKRDIVVKHLHYLSQEHQTSVEQLVSETKSRLMASTGGVSVVFVADNTRSDEKPSPESYLPNNVKCFLQEICQRCISCQVKRLRLVNVRFSGSRSDFNALKVTTTEMKACVREQGIVCFGVFVCTPVHDNQQEKIGLSKLIEKAVQLTTTAMLDAPSELNGQTFDTIT